MGLLGGLVSSVFGGGGGGGGSSSSSSSQSTTTNNYDNRVVSDNRDYSAFGSNNTSTSTVLTDSRDMSTVLTDSRDMSTVLTDSRNMSTAMTDSRGYSGSFNTTSTTIDAGAVAMAEKLGIASLKNNSDGLALLVGAFKDTATAVVDTAGKSIAAVQSAYSSSASESSGSKNIQLAALAVVGLAVAMAFGGARR